MLDGVCWMLEKMPGIQHPASSSLFQGAAVRHEQLLGTLWSVVSDQRLKTDGHR
jgi:hypothetical protein